MRKQHQRMRAQASGPRIEGKDISNVPCGRDVGVRRAGSDAIGDLTAKANR